MWKVGKLLNLMVSYFSIIDTDGRVYTLFMVQFYVGYFKQKKCIGYSTKSMHAKGNFIIGLNS